MTKIRRDRWDITMDLTEKKGEAVTDRTPTNEPTSMKWTNSRKTQTSETN